MLQEPLLKTAERTRKLIEGMEQLPSAPESAGRILAAATAEYPDFQELVSCIETDPAVSIRVLRLANSAGFNRAERVGDIRQAAMLLGTDTLCTVALCVSVREGLFAAFGAGDALVREYWRHSLACACAARLLAGHVRPRMAGIAFAAGLIHDCGKLALITAAREEYAPLMRDEFLMGQRLVKAEQEVLGTDHCLAGKWLLERWRLPEIFVDAVWMHHQPVPALIQEAVSNPLALMVSLADRLAHEATGTLPGAAREPSFLAAAQALGVEGPAIPGEVVAGVGKQFAERAWLFDLNEDAGAFYCNALGRANRRLGEANLGLAGKSRELELGLNALRRVALTGVDITAAETPGEVLLAIAKRMHEDFASPGGLACMIYPESRLAEGHCWGFGGGVRPVLLRLRADLSPEPEQDGAGVLPDSFTAHLAGCRTRASALAGPEGPPVHFLDGVGMVGLTGPGGILGELLFVPQSGAVTPEERSAMSLLAQLAAQAFRRLELMKRCEMRSERLSQVMRSMQEMNDKLLKTQRLAAVGQLAAGAAHEINNPLAIISARAQLLEMRESDPAKKKGLRQMVDQIERISAILGSLMDFARPAAPRMETVTPREVMDRVLGFLEGSLVNQGVKVVREYDPQAPEIKADVRQLEQVLLNLVLNAQHAMEEGGGTLTAAIVFQPASDTVSFSVADTGVGIPRENLEKVFDPFFTTKPEGKGTGLGLSTAYGIVQAHKGRIVLESEPGKGTTFTVVLPRDLTAQARPAPAAQPERPARASVLVVDDESHIRDILRESLESNGYAVEMAEDGESALSLLRQNRYKLMILDIRMPSRDGLAVLREAASFLSPGMPVLVLTGMASEEELEEAKALGASACMRKPFQVDALLAEVGRLAGKEPGA